MSKYQSIDVLQFRDNIIIAYEQYCDILPTYEQTDKALINRNKQLYTGLVTDYSRKNILKSLHVLNAITPSRWVFSPILNRMIKHRISFATFTLSGIKEGWSAKDYTKNLLDKLLIDLRRKHGLRNYVWKLEYQTNGNVHYHLASDLYIHYDTLRNLWNRHQDKHGLIDSYYDKHGHKHPNSTDIHAKNANKNMADYMAKYMSKSNASPSDHSGKIWDCSKNIKGVNYFRLTPHDPEFIDMDILMNEKLFTREHKDRCTIYRPINSRLLDLLPRSVVSAYRAYFASLIMDS